jgi:hypothetical protein
LVINTDLLSLSIITCMLLWVIIVFIYRDKVKKPWLFLLFPYAIVFLPVAIVLTKYVDILVIISETILTIYYVYRSVTKKIGIYDLGIIPIIQLILLLYLVITGREVCIVA